MNIYQSNPAWIQNMTTSTLAKASLYTQDTVGQSHRIIMLLHKLRLPVAKHIPEGTVINDVASRNLLVKANNRLVFLAGMDAYPPNDLTTWWSDGGTTTSNADFHVDYTVSARGLPVEDLVPGTSRCKLDDES
jgi:hypothetical protein